MQGNFLQRAAFAVLVSSTILAGGPAFSSDGQPEGAVIGQRHHPDHIDVVFVLDTTGSMGGLIEGAKQKIWAIADTIRHENPNAEIRIGLVAYRDRGDAYVTETTRLSGDIQQVYARLLQVQAQGGGDWPESVNEALHVAVADMDWSRNPADCRLVFLVGDAPPHMDYAQDIPFTDTMKIASREGIIVNAVQAGRAQDTAAMWRTIAQLGGGDYIPIPQTGGVVVIETPFDQDIIILQKQLNETVIPYGSLSQQQEVGGKVVQNLAAPAPAASDMASYKMRSTKSAGRVVVTGAGDLTNDVQSGKVALDKLKAEELPKPMQAMDADARRKYVETNVAAREKIQGELAAVVAKRDAYLAEKRSASSAPKDSFDAAVLRVVQAQIK